MSVRSTDGMCSVGKDAIFDEEVAGIVESVETGTVFVDDSQKKHIIA